ncbi:MAG: TIGR00730 family Rossman fold protein [SAR324 cluster bacterium]|nr:TIGR00730 family Rossman fold protein [SAR324 cluster bacterium]
MSKRNLCVFCGSRLGKDPDFKNAAIQVADFMAKGGWDLVYGGGSVGLMGVIADQALTNGCKVTGVIPHYIHELEVGHSALSETIFTEDMQTRKALMAEKSDAFLILPGGFGTLDELFEFAALSQLNQHQKPLVLFNQKGFYDPLVAQIQIMESQDFLNSETAGIIKEAKSVTEIFQILS